MILITRHLRTQYNKKQSTTNGHKTRDVKKKNEGI